MDREASVLLKEHGLRATKQRVEMLTFLESASSPLSIQDISLKLRRSMDNVTVYRILDTFKVADIVREVHLHSGRICYELVDHEHDHHHVVCTKCHRTEDFVGCEAEKAERSAMKQVKGFAKITGHSLELFGLCTKCAR